MAKLSLSRFGKVLIPEPGHQRVYGLAALVNTFGFGLIMPSIVLYFTQVKELPALQVGLGFTISGLVALVTSVPGGHLADRIGPRGVVQVTMLLQAIATFAYLFIDGFLAFVIIATAEMLVTNANMAATGALIRRVGGEHAVTFRSNVRAISHVGISLGVLCAGAAIQIGTAAAYQSLLIINGTTFLLACLLLFRLPRYEPLPQPEDGPRWTALVDRPFVAYTSLAGVMSIQYFVIEMPLPLWIVTETTAPRWSIPLFFLTNTILVILMQVRIGEKVQTIQQGGEAMRKAGLVFLISCAGIALAAGLPGWVALVVLFLAVAVHTYGELWFSTGSFALDFGLAPAHSQGQYQGLSSMGTGLGSAAAPALLVGLLLSFGQLGWLGLGVLLALLGLAAPAIARWGERTRPAEELAPAASALAPAVSD